MGIYKKGENYYIDYYVNGRRKREKVGPSRALAKKALEARKGEIVREKYQLPRKKAAPLFEEFVPVYLNYIKGYKKSYDRDVSTIKRLLGKFRGKRLDAIHPFLVESYKIERRKQVKPATVNKELGCLRHMYNMAIKWDYAEKNPVREVKFFKENNQRLRYLSQEEASALVEACAPHLRPVVIVALNTGMRRGEIFHLRWEHVDFGHRWIRVVESKNGESRIIPMNDVVYRTLREQRRQLKADFVFVNGKGKPYRNIKYAFRKALERAGIDDFHFHDLRHTFASNLVMAGEDLVTVKELLGHKSIQMTMRYSHLSQKHKMAAVQRLSHLYESEDGHYLDTEVKSSDLIEVVK